MKYLKLFEKKEKMIELVGYPEGNIIKVTEDEFIVLQSGNAINPSTDDNFDIRWDSEIDYKEDNYGQWRFMNEEENELEEWLEDYRLVTKSGIDDPEAIKDIRKYNL